LSSSSLGITKKQRRPGVRSTGGSPQYAATAVWVVDFSASLDHIRAALGDAEFDEHVAVGAAKNAGDALRYTRDQIQLARAQTLP
jgi:hypothetical protein